MSEKYDKMSNYIKGNAWREKSEKKKKKQKRKTEIKGGMEV